METKKFIDFIITQKCTYKCAYCSQSKAQTSVLNDADENTINAFLNLLDKIDKDFEITLTGGEALLHPDFFDLAQKVKSKGFKINLITNLSFEIEKYSKIFSLLNSSLNKFDISFHLDEIKDFDKTIDKLRKVLEIKPITTETNFLIPIYNLTDKKQEQIEIIQDIAKNNNVNCDFQHIRFLNKYKKNNKTEQKYIQNKPVNSYARYCFAGSSSAVIYENGECYRCYSSRFLKSNYLGNIKDRNFSLLSSAKPCVHKICTCPKPYNYNQITDRKSPLKAFILKMYNGIFMPYYILKNSKIIKQKIKQLTKNRF